MSKPKISFLFPVFFISLAVVMVSFSILAESGGASFSFSPASGSYQVNEEFEVELKINSTKPVTSLKAYIVFNPNFLSLTQLEINENQFPFWWEKEETPAGLIKLQSSVPLPGFQGETLVSKMRFQAKRFGKAAIVLESGSLILGPQDENLLYADSLPGADFSLVLSQTPKSMLSSSIFSPGIIAFFVLAGIAVILFFGIWLKGKRRVASKKQSG